MEAQALAEAGRRDEASRAVEQLLMSGAAHRKADALRLAIRLAGPHADCSLIEPRLQTLVERGATAAELGRLADCVATRAPARARLLLLQALDTGPDREEKAALERRLGELPP